jgi:F-type H+-transporting ATPase subunit b
MSVFSTILIAAADEEHHAIDETHSWILPETAEIIYGSIAFVAVVFLFIKVFKVHKLVGKALNARTERIQKELDDSAAARAAAEAEAAQIRQAAGDIEAERTRLFAEADTQAEALVADSRVRLDAEVAELQARAEADIAAAASRTGDELHAEIARLAVAATERLVVTVVDDATQQELVETFIQRVGASV